MFCIKIIYPDNSCYQSSWHVQSGTSLQELQQLGGWSSFEMVLRYAHLSSNHLKDAAERIAGTILVHPIKKGLSESHLSP